MTVSNQPCFHIWDTSSNYYELGCTSDSLQYYTNSSGRTNYRWDLDTEMAAAQGPNTPQRHINVHYLQDITTANNLTSVRDASIEQVQYGVLSADGKTFTPSGTVDFLYRAPSDSSSVNGLGQSWGTAYGNNFACDTTTFPLLASTTLRCDDPIQDGSVPPPTVMSTMMLQTIETFVGDDSSATHMDYKYTLGYDDLPFVGCNDPFALIAEFCPNNLLLTSITPIPFLQGNSQHALHPVSFGYQELDNSYIDTTQKVLDNLTLY